MNIGDYVRTKKGILKIRDDKPFKDDKNKLNYLTYGNYTCVLKEDIIKSSSNIIDLIEVGDYVNGMIVNDIVDNRFNLVGYFDNWLEEKDIKSIVTREQFSQTEYKVGD